MSDPLQGPRIKLGRAQDHLIELERVISEFFDGNPCRVVFDTDSEPGYKLAKIKLTSPTPEMIHVLAGEIIYQLRSALDQTAVAFARLSKGAIKPKPKQVHYPTGKDFTGFAASCGSRDDKGRLVGNLRYFDHDLRKAIMKTRPYDGGNDNLRAVFRMANIDKHMELIAVGTTGGLSGLSEFTVDGTLMLTGPGDLKEGVTIAKLPLNGEFRPNSLQAQMNISGLITLGEVGPYTGKPLVPLLRAMIEEVRSAHSDFEDVLIERGDMPPRIIYWPLVI